MARGSCHLFLPLVLIISEVIGKDFLLEMHDNGNVGDDNELPEEIPSGDYSMPAANQRKQAAVGSKTTLKCESPIPFNDCKFRAPNGDVHRIGIGGGSSYDRARVDCLCVEEEYDPTKVCGIYIKDLNKEDTGTWTCEMDFKRGGRVTKKTATTFMQVGDVPDVVTDGSIDNTDGDEAEKLDGDDVGGDDHALTTPRPPKRPSFLKGYDRYECIQWTQEEKRIITANGWDRRTEQMGLGKEKPTCEKRGHDFIFTGGDNAKAPGCGDCWCCKGIL